ncbi:hypothetical protein [Microbacterium sp. GXF6406]
MQRTWIREVGGWVWAALLAIITVGQVAASDRGELLFRDGDSLVVALLVRSVADGESFDWVLSSVLFLPELVVFGMLWAIGALFGIGTNALLVVNAVLNVLALYGALRFVAGARRANRSPVLWPVLAIALFCVLAVTEASASRDSFELASLLLTTTYYSATIIAVLLSVGLIRREFDRPSAGRLLPVFLAAVAAISVLSNPLFVAWATLPLSVLLAIAAAYQGSRARALPLLGWLVGGSVVGALARIPFSAYIGNDGIGYAQPALWPESLRYYGALLADRVMAPLGAVAAIILIALLALAVRRTIRAQSTGERLVAASAWALPLCVTIGAIALGTHAARYLEPAAFAPLLALVASPSSIRPLPTRKAMLAVTASAAVIAVAAATLSVPRAAAASRVLDADLQCVNEWVTASDRTGAGQFWTVRLPKLHLDDASQLVQVDHRLNPYPWLINRQDFTIGEVSFLVEDANSSFWELGSDLLPTGSIDCGRYTIHDFAPNALPLGPLPL